MPNNETRLHRAARRLQRATELNYTAARALLAGTDRRRWPNFDDAAAVAVFVAITTPAAPTAPAAPDKRIVATFIPQEWIGDTAADVDASRYTFDCTAQIVAMGREAALAIRDRSDAADAVWYAHPVSDQRPWDGPFEVEVAAAIAAYYDDERNTPEPTETVRFDRTGRCSECRSYVGDLGPAGVCYPCVALASGELIACTNCDNWVPSTGERCDSCGADPVTGEPDESQLRRHLRRFHSLDSFDADDTEESLAAFHHWDHETGTMGPEHDPDDLLV